MIPEGLEARVEVSRDIGCKLFGSFNQGDLRLNIGLESHGVVSCAEEILVDADYKG